MIGNFELCPKENFNVILTIRFRHTCFPYLQAIRNWCLLDCLHMWWRKLVFIPEMRRKTYSLCKTYSPITLFLIYFLEEEYLLSSDKLHRKKNTKKENIYSRYTYILLWMILTPHWHQQFFCLFTRSS